MRLWRRGKGAETDRPGDPQVKPSTRPEAAPEAVLADLDRGERVLATAQEDMTGHWLVLTTWRLLERAEDGSTVLDQPWLAVDTGAWDPDAWLLTVSFVEGSPPRQWALQRRTGPGMVPEVFWDRTTASVVLTRAVDLGPRRTARVTVRKDLRSRELSEQVLLGRGSRPTDAELMRHVLIARQEVRGQVGLAPVDGAD